MQLFPPQTIHYRTALTSDEVLSRLAERVGPLQEWRYSITLFGSKVYETPRNKPFEGQIDGSTFELRSLNRDHFPIHLSGVVSDEHGEVFINVAFRLSSKMKGFSRLWIFLTSAAFIVALVAMILTQTLYFQAFIPLVLLVPGIFGLRKGYKKELAKSERLLHEIFESQTSN